MRCAPGLFKLKPEVLQKQVGNLTEEYGALFVEGTLRDGFIVPQVELVTGIKFLRVLKEKREREKKKKTSLRLSLRFCTSS